MIATEQVIPRILMACPGFREGWARRAGRPDEERGIYARLTDVADYIVRSYGREATSEFPLFFETLEQLLGEGDEEVREAVSVGLIEDIQNIASHESFGYQVFEKWLGPMSRDAWAQAEQTWLGQHSFAGVLRAEAGQSPEPEAIPDISKIENPELAKLLRAMYRVPPAIAEKKRWWKFW